MEVIDVDSPKFILSSRGKKQIILGSYKYGIHRTNGSRTRWWCTTHNNKGCKASLMTIDNEIVKINDSVAVARPKFVTSSRGRKQMILGRYKFGIHRQAGPKARWWCTTHKCKGCRATIMTYDDEIIKINNVHNH
ncbi:hypothetical protein JYU34_004398 [Plutella xylostella]|uniref:FLYWCH-type domain-containing protein n=1 Tax=Plutella xylostella TaxID=51655 RepID=A0ABQ7QY06_PLUXY|nr:hypothetical protein JYU34_004398 [Plutella xylostella]